MKYANGYVFVAGGKQVGAFVCAKTYKRMIELLDDWGISKYYFNDYWNKCGNDKMKELAQDKESVWFASDYIKRDYKKVL